MQRLATDTVSPGPWWDKEEQIVSVHVPLMIGTEVSHNFGILSSKDNPASSVQVDDNGNMAPTLAGYKP